MPKEFRQITFEFSDAGEAKQQENSPVSVPETEEKLPPLPKQKRGRKKLSEEPPATNMLNLPADEELFQKQYYAIGEVAGMFGVNNSLIRYWEKEFDILQPRKNRKGDRFFKPSDIKNLQLIHDLLRRRKFTIEGAKAFIKKCKQVKEKQTLIESLQQFKSFLLELKANL